MQFSIILVCLATAAFAAPSGFGLPDLHLQESQPTPELEAPVAVPVVTEEESPVAADTELTQAEEIHIVDQQNEIEIPAAEITSTTDEVVAEDVQETVVEPTPEVVVEEVQETVVEPTPEVAVEEVQETVAEPTIEAVVEEHTSEPVEEVQIQQDEPTGNLEVPELTTDAAVEENVAEEVAVFVEEETPVAEEESIVIAAAKAETPVDEVVEQVISETGLAEEEVAVFIEEETPVAEEESIVITAAEAETPVDEVVEEVVSETVPVEDVPRETAAEEPEVVTEGNEVDSLVEEVVTEVAVEQIAQKIAFPKAEQEAEPEPEAEISQPLIHENVIVQTVTPTLTPKPIVAVQQFSNTIPTEVKKSRTFGQQKADRGHSKSFTSNNFNHLNTIPSNNVAIHFGFHNDASVRVSERKTFMHGGVLTDPKTLVAPQYRSFIFSNDSPEVIAAKVAFFRIQEALTLKQQSRV